MLKASDLFAGVKTTLKRVAEKFEFAMQGFSDFDSIRYSAVDDEVRHSRTVTMVANGDIMREERMLGVLCKAMVRGVEC